MQKFDRLEVLNAIFEQSYNSIVITDAQIELPGPKFLYVNKAFTKMTGYTIEDLKDKTPRILQGEKTDMDIIKHLKECLIKNEYFTGSTINYTKDGKEYYVEWNISPIKDENGKTIYFTSVQKDISKQKQLEIKLKEEKEKFESIFKNSKDGIAILDMDSKFLEFNNSYLNMLGFSEEELREKTCIELSVEEDKQKSIDSLKQVLEKGYIQNFEKVCLTKEGKRITINMSATLLPDKKRFLIVTKDISSLKLLESQSKLASMGEMIGNIAHQWRQPLSVISTYASGLGMKVEYNMKLSPDEIKNFTEQIIKQADYLSRTIDDFRHFIKGENNSSHLSIKEAIEDSLLLVNSSLKANHIDLVTDIKDDLEVLGSKSELEQVFINIINNSKDILCKNTELDKRYIFISSKLIDDDSLEIKILDNGGGIKEDLIDKIFEPYFTTKHQSIGTGLGLSMSDKIIRERYNGSITIYNEVFDYNAQSYQGACCIIILKTQK